MPCFATAFTHIFLLRNFLFIRLVCYVYKNFEFWSLIISLETINFLWMQIRSLGDTSRGSRHHCGHLAIGGARLVCANIIWAASAWTAARLRGQRQEISNVCSRSDAYIRHRLQLHQLLCSLYSYDRHLLQVNYLLIEVYLSYFKPKMYHHPSHYHQVSITISLLRQSCLSGKFA